MAFNKNQPVDQLSQKSDDRDTEDSPVKVRSFEQREALPGEPQCIICGRYGEYICDQTDDDICSTECKNILLSRLSAKKPVIKAAKPLDIPVVDECFYVSGSNGTNLQGFRSEEVSFLRSKLDITVKGEHIPDPILVFSSCDLPVKLEKNLESAGYVIPTPVQMQCVPAVMGSRNLLVSAETGSGKTAAFLLPIIAQCSQVRSRNTTEERRPLAVVVTPTRELCAQVEELAKVLAKGLPLKTALVVGGEAMASQLYRIQNGIELIICTPGRMIDLLTKHDIELNEVLYFVLDEVDALLQKGFEDQVMQLFRALPQPQVLMFSATISSGVEKMATTIAKDLVYISCGKPNKPTNSVKQVVIWVDNKLKKQKIFEIFMSKKHFKPPAVVFVASKLGADLLSEAISTSTGIRTLAIHGDKTMAVRRDSLKLFLTGELPVIVSTGVLGRGMDLLKVRQVIIFDMPSTMEEYTHQIGRASRMGTEGEALVFVNEDDRRHFTELVQVLKSAGAPVPHELANSKYALHPYSAAKNKKRKSQK